MAAQLEKPMRRPNVVLRRFAMDAVQALQANMQTQHVFPTEIYPGFRKVNEYRKDHGGWYATGKGVRSFTSRLDATPGHEAISLGFRDYLRFVDMGTVGGRPLDVVRRDRKARHNRRYVRQWLAVMGETSRPSIMMEARHVASRMQRYYEDFYGRELSVEVFRDIADLPPLVFQF